MKLSHPVDDNGLEEFRTSIERMFDDQPGGVGSDALEEFGWFDLLDEEPELATRALFEGQGSALGTGSTVDGFVLAQLASAGVAVPDASHTAVLLQHPDGSGGYIGFAHEGFAPAQYLFQSKAAPAELRLVDAPLANPAPLRSIDDSVSLVRVDGSIDTAGRIVATVHPSTVESLTATALALQLTGLCERLLVIGRDYALIREQFGTAIAQFQAVQHLLANAAVSAAAAQGASTAAVRALGDAERFTLTSLVAAGSAVRATTTVTRAVQQVLGAVGYTREHEFHRFLDRGLLLAYLLGAPTLDSRIAAAALAAGTPPITPTSAWYDAARKAATS